MSLGSINGFCNLGATRAVTSGLASSNFLQGIVPSGLVTVYLTGTTTLATIYADANMTVLSNPFTAKTDGSYIFWVGGVVDIVLSGGIPPNSYIAPRTITGVGPSGSGVTSINSLTGAVFIQPGTGIGVNTSSPNITISTSTPFVISSFTGQNGLEELGFSFSNPVFGATYSATPASGNITNTDSISSPTAIIPANPSSTTITGTFSHNTTGATTTFTLSATQGTTQTASLTTTWEPRIFGGVGAAGASSSVTSSTTTAVLSTGDILASAGLGAETVGETFGPYTTSNQCIYLLLLGGSHTFIDPNRSATFAFNAPIAVSFVNQFGVTVNMYLYQSTNPLFGVWSVRVAT